MDPTFPDLELQLADLPDHLALLAALRGLSREVGKTDAAADVTFHEIRWAIEGLQNRILRESKMHGRVEYLNRNETANQRKERVAKGKRLTQELAKSKELAARPTDFIARLVRIASYQLGKFGQPRLGKQKAQDRALAEDFPLVEEERRVNRKSDLRPAESRAIEIIQGEKPKAKKNPIERTAIQLARAVIADFSRKKESGRPAGRPDIIFDVENFQHNLKLTVIEVIEVVLPKIEDLAGSKNSSAPGSMMIAAVAGAVRSGGLECDLGLAAEYVRRLRRRRSAATL
jgi:hypothetical protein